MIRLNRRFALSALLIAGISGSAGAGAVAVAESQQAPDEVRVANEVQAVRAKLDAIRRYAGQGHTLARLAGADPNEARALGRTASGLTISSVDGRDARCVVMSDSNSFCATPEQVGNGQSYDVLSDCGRPGGVTRITAVLPTNAISANLVDSDDSATPMKVAGGVAWIEVQTPSNGAAAPTEIRPRDMSATNLPVVTLPGFFCPGP